MNFFYLSHPYLKITYQFIKLQEAVIKHKPKQLHKSGRRYPPRHGWKWERAVGGDESKIPGNK